MKLLNNFDKNLVVITEETPDNNTFPQYIICLGTGLTKCELNQNGANPPLHLSIFLSDTNFIHPGSIEFPRYGIIYSLSYLSYQCECVHCSGSPIHDVMVW